MTHPSASCLECIKSMHAPDAPDPPPCHRSVDSAPSIPQSVVGENEVAPFRRFDPMHSTGFDGNPPAIDLRALALPIDRPGKVLPHSPPSLGTRPAS